VEATGIFKRSPTAIRMCDVQGNPMDVRGCIVVPITIKGQTKVWTLTIIEKFDADLILGADFMSSMKVTQDFENKTIDFKDNSDPKWKTKQINVVYKTFIPDNHHIKVKCKVETPNNVILKPGSLVITKRNTIEDGVYLEETLTKVLRRNRIFVVITNNNPYSVFVKPSQCIGEVIDTSKVELIPVNEAKIFKYGVEEATGPIPLISDEKKKFLLENFNCPVNDPMVRQQYEDLILKNHQIFSENKQDIGFSDIVSHKINMKTKEPVYVKQFRIPDTHEQEIINHLDEWKKQNIIEECSSPYNTPIFCVPKKDGGLRIVQDFREINKKSFDDKYAIKDVQECVDIIGKAGSRIFSTLDMASGFWQQNLDINSRDYTAFTIPLLNTQFRWSRTSQGLKGGPGSFARLTALVFRGICQAITYIDDLLCHTQTHTEHLQVLQECFDRMIQFNLKFNIKKCCFGSTSVTYLGFQISEEGVSPAKDKIEAIRAFQPPTNLKEVRAFIGFCNYFRRMVLNFSSKASGLVDLTKKDSGWSSGPLPITAQTSFETLKNCLSNNPVIGFSRPGGQYIITADASCQGLGAILSQTYNNEEKVVSFWSRTLREHEKNYTPYMLEMSAVCCALEHFHEYVFGHKIRVYTDHRPLLGTSVLQKKTMNRLVEKMNIYNIDLKYKKGCENTGADYLSRNACKGIFAISQGDRFEELRKHQKTDVLSCAIRKFLDHNVLPGDQSLCKMVTILSTRTFVKDDMLWYVLPKTNKDKAVFFTPRSMVNTIITNAHGKPLTGHWGIERTVERILSSYYWPTLSKDVETHIIHCDPCQRAKRPPKNAMLTPWPQALKPNERVHVDLFGPLRGDHNFKYVAVITCAFSRWTEVVAIPNKEAITVAKAIFEEWVCRKGVPKLLVSDNGKEFANSILEELCILMRIDKHLITSYHPQANAQCERFNRDMRKYLMTMLEETADWVTYLKPLQFAHNTALNKSTRYTPHYLTFLDDPRLPDSINERNVTYSDSYTANAFRRLQYAYNLVYKNNEKAREEYTKQFNKKSKTRHFEIGDEVLVSFPIPLSVVNKKLSTIWKGPFRVIETTENILKVQASPRSKIITLHVNRVQLFHHFKDVVTIPTQPENTIPAEKPDELEVEEDEDDYVGNVMNEEQVEEVNEEQINDVLPDGPVPIVPPLRLFRHNRANWGTERPILDRLADEIFGPSQRTRSRGPVTAVPLPDRPVEYKKNQKKK
jgi:transposase InsO family protein